MLIMDHCHTKQSQNFKTVVAVMEEQQNVKNVCLKPNSVILLIIPRLLRFQNNWDLTQIVSHQQIEKIMNKNPGSFTKDFLWQNKKVY